MGPPPVNCPTAALHLRVQLTDPEPAPAFLEVVVRQVACTSWMPVAYPNADELRRSAINPSLSSAAAYPVVQVDPAGTGHPFAPTPAAATFTGIVGLEANGTFNRHIWQPGHLGPLRRSGNDGGVELRIRRHRGHRQRPHGCLNGPGSHAPDATRESAP